MVNRSLRRRRLFRADFDRGLDFIATKDFVFNGRKLTPGQTIDKTQFTSRKLRQLYDTRFIGLAKETNVRPPELSFRPSPIPAAAPAPTEPAPKPVVPRHKPVVERKRDRPPVARKKR